MKFNCRECHKKFSAKNAWSKHISTFHHSQEYYDKWLKNSDVEDICPVCSGKNIFISAGKGYKNGCCREHIVKINHIKIQDSMIKKYGVKSSLSLDEIRTGGMVKKYGVKNAGELDWVKDKIRNTNLQKYGVENPYQSEVIKEKIRKTNLKKYGVEYPTQSEEIRGKIKESFRKSYNCEYALQNPTFFEKQQKSSRYARKYNNHLIYRSSYEFDFLDRYYSKVEIQNGPTIKYSYSGRNRIYYPDYYIKSLNLIVEIKGSYLIKKDPLILKAKKQETINRGYNFIMIVDKDYSEFDRLPVFAYSVP